MKKWISRLTTVSLTAAMVLSMAPAAVYAEGENAAGTAASASPEQYTAAADSGETEEEAAFTAGSDGAAAEAGSGASADEAAVTAGSGEAAIEAGSGASADEAAAEAGSEDAATEASSEEAASEASSEEAADTAASVEKVTASSTQLAAPTVKWGGDYNNRYYNHEMVTITSVPNCENGYELKMYNGDELVYHVSEMQEGSFDSEFSFMVGHKINESGIYKVYVRARGGTGTGYQDSEWAVTDAWSYTAPDKIATPSAPVWSTDAPGTCIFTPGSDAYGYEMDVVLDDKVVESTLSYTIWDHEEDYSGSLGVTGIYKARFRLLSDDLTKYANSDFSEFSVGFDSSLINDTIKTNIDAATKAVKAASDNSAVVSALKTLTDKYSEYKLSGAVKADPAVRESLSALENAYSSRMGITVDKTVDSSAAGAMNISADEIKVLGAGLDTTTENQQLHFTIKQASADLSAAISDYTAPFCNIVQCSINLEGVKYASTMSLKVPVYITMPVPKGVNKDKLVLLNFNEGSTKMFDILYPVLNEDGTISFQLDNFGNCAFANSGKSDTTAATPFTDLGSSAWVNTAVSYVYGKGLMKGTSDTTFNPTGTLTRGMFAAILYRTAGSPSVTYTQKFSDVPSGKYYSLAVTWASNSGLISGYGDTGRFGPNNNITRAQIAKILYLYAKSKGYDLTADADLSGFADASKLKGNFVVYMKWAVSKGLISGATSGSEKYLNPGSSATRAQCAKMIKQFLINCVK